MNDYVTREVPHLAVTATPNLPDDIPVLKLFIHLFVDAFGALNRLYHSTGGVYVTLGNMPRAERLKIENMYLFGLAQPGWNITSLIHIFNILVYFRIQIAEMH